MSLELANQPVNIKDILLDQPEEEIRPFDSKIDLTEHDGQMILTTLEMRRDESPTQMFSGFGFLTSALKVLYLDIDPKTYLQPSDFEALMDKIRLIIGAPIREVTTQIRLNTFREKLLGDIFTVLILYPDKLFQQKLDTELPTWLAMADQIDTLKRSGDWEGVIDLSLVMKILVPERLSDEVKFTDQDKSSMFGLLTPKLAKSGYGDYKWHYFSSIASNLKMLFPDESDHLRLNNRSWKGMKEDLERMRKKESWYNFADHALNMAIVASKKLEISKNGLVMEFAESTKPFIQVKLDLPEARNF